MFDTEQRPDTGHDTGTSSPRSAGTSGDTGMINQVISANRLGDGAVVYMTANGEWSEHIAQAQATDGKEQGEAALDVASGAVRTCIVVDPYLIDIDDRGGERRPTLNRELIRALGPTVRLDLGKQAAR